MSGAKTGTLSQTDFLEETGAIHNVEIFRAGNYGEKGTFTVHDLDVVIETFDPSVHRAPVTLDHAESGPAYGWITKLWRIGKSLFADLKDVPNTLIEAIRKGRYKERSIEIYKHFGDTGKPMIKAVSFLGAAVPNIKGMAPVEFTEGESTVIAWADAVSFHSLEPSESPGGHETITHNDRTEETLGHYHTAYLDAEATGFTSRPMSYNDEVGFEVETEGHIHVITAGAVQPAESSGGIDHSHPMMIVSTTMSESQTTKNSDPIPKEEPKTMAEPKTDPKAKEKTGEQWAKENAALASKVKELEATKMASDEAVVAMTTRIEAIEDERFQEKEAIRFSKVYDEAHAKGKIPAAEKASLRAIFDTLPKDTDPAAIKMSEGEGKKTPRQVHLDTMANRTPILEMGEVAGNADFTGKKAAPTKANAAERVVVIMKEEGVDFVTATIKAAKEIEPAEAAV